MFFSPSERSEPSSTKSQFYTLPKRYKVHLVTLLLNGAFFVLFGGGILYVSNGDLSYSWFSLGLLCHVIGLMMILGVIIAAYSVVTKAEFTVDSVFIHQFGRRAVRLPYNEYSFQWIADIRTTGNLRLLMVDHHRGCTIFSPPTWLRANFEEISRIQREEGWYAPEAGYVPPQPRKPVPTKISE